MAPHARTRSRTDSVEPTSVIGALIGVGLFLVPLGHGWLVATQPPESRIDLRVFVYPSDIVLVAACVFAVPLVARRFRRRDLGDPLVALAALVVLTLVATVVHPSAQAFQSVLRLAGCLVLAIAVASLPRRAALTAVGGVAAAGALQSALAVVQVVRGSTLGWSVLAERTGPLWIVGSELAPRGTFVHHYRLAGWALVTVAAVLVAFRRASPRRVPIAVVLAAVAVPVGLTFSRAAAIGVVGIFAALTLPGRDAVGRRLAAAALVVGIGVAALSVSAGWWTRASDEGSDLTNQRSSHVEESFELIGRHPLFGAGPGRYLVALQHEVRQDPGVDLAPVHNFVLLAAAESGILAGAAALAFMGALALRAIRGGWWSVAAYATFVPYLVFDHFPFTTPEGLVMTAMWTGSVLLLAEERSAGSARSPVAVDAQRHAEEVDGPAAHR